MKIKSLCKAFFLLLLAILFVGCDGPQGPVGPEGPPGPTILPASFEFFADLNQDNGFEAFMEIPEEIEVFDSDVIIVFILEDYIEEDDLEVWRQLPITDFTEDGTRVMNFDFTFVDVRLFLDTDYQLGQNDEFFDLLFRAVHVPADFAGNLNAVQMQTAQSPEELERMLDVEVRELGRKE